jgi:two-component system OmpR family sensor kinase
MNKLWARLTLAFGLVTMAAVIIAALLANYQVGVNFRQFMAHGQVMSTTIPMLADYYAENNSWQGVEPIFETLHSQGGGNGGGNGRGMRYGAPKLILADAAGQIIFDESGSRTTEQLSRAELAEALPIENNGQTMGYLLPLGQSQFELTGAAQSFLNEVNRSLLQAALIAAGLGVLIGWIMARGLSAPLVQLAAAARRLAQGQFDERVSVRGAEELTDLAGAFNEMAANLQQADSLRRNLVADIAHELRTPLSIIQGNLQAILDDVYPLDKTEIADIFDETIMLNRLISDLRELAQAEAGQLQLHRQPTDLLLLVKTVTDLFGESAREKEITLQTALSPKIPSLPADADRLRQVLHNLLGNAVRHTPAGGVVTVAADLINGDESVQISVTDTGPGIAPEDLPHVFDRFWRADKSRAREYGGSGLGLAIARQLVEAHGGQIGVRSPGASGPGSQFWFTLPMKKE